MELSKEELYVVFSEMGNSYMNDELDEVGLTLYNKIEKELEEYY